jgi:hypothetical protein
MTGLVAAGLVAEGFAAAAGLVAGLAGSLRLLAGTLEVLAGTLEVLAGECLDERGVA